MNLPTDRHGENADLRQLSQGLREIDGLENAPNLTDRILERLATDDQDRAHGRSGLAIYAAAAVLLLGLAVPLTIAVLGPDGQAEDARGGNPLTDAEVGHDTQDPTRSVQPTPPPVVRTQADIEALPRSTRAVRGEGLSRESLRALRRLPLLTHLELEPALETDALADVTRLDKLQSLAVKVTGAIDRNQLRVLADLPMLRQLRIDATHPWTDSSLRHLARLQHLELLNVHGDFECKPEALGRLTALESLRRLELETPGSRNYGRSLTDAHLSKLPLRQLRFLTVRGQIDVTGAFLERLQESSELYGLDLAGPGIRSEALMHVPVSVRQLTLAELELDCTHLAKLIDLEVLDLESARVPVLEQIPLGMGIVPFDFYEQAKHWPRCIVQMPNGSSYRVTEQTPGDAAFDSGVIAVQLLARTGQDYEASAYSFRVRSRDPDVHRNYVDLVYAQCGNLHFNAHGGMSSRVLDLGVGKLADAESLQHAKGRWLESSFRPRAGHVYAHSVSVDGKTMLVKYRIDEVSSEQISFRWQPWDEDQTWPPPPAGRGAAGTMGTCGGAHAPR